jgi:hypothetical protein
MRFWSSIRTVVGVGALGGIAAIACSSSSNPAPGTGDGGVLGSGDAGMGGGTTDSGGGGGTVTDAGPPCSPKASCTAADKTCMGLVDNTGQTKFGLRMTELDLTSPTALTTGIVKNIAGGAVGLNIASCNLSGSATFSWLLQFDTAAMTLKTGGAKPVADPTQGYSFDTETLNGVNIAPVTFNNITPDSSGSFSVTMGTDLAIPIVLTAAGTSSIVLPLHQARIVNGTLSSNHNCIGAYNAAGLDPTSSCNPDGTHPQFISAASLDGYMTLEEADQIMITAANESLCVLLSGNATMYGATQDGGPAQVCKRDSGGKILYQGHWCASTNSAATTTCADAEQLKGTFSAGSVKILN